MHEMMIWVKSAISENYILIPRWLYEQADEYINQLNGQPLKLDGNLIFHK